MPVICAGTRPRSCLRSSIASPPLAAGTSRPVPTAATGGSRTTVAGTGTASDARAPPHAPGSRPARPTCFRSAISTSSSPSPPRSEEHTSELQSLMRIPYAVFCLKKKKIPNHHHLPHSIPQLPLHQPILYTITHTELHQLNT